MRKNLYLDEAVNTFRVNYNLEVESPFKLNVNGTKAEFDCLVRGYGARKGMIVDRYWSNIRPVADLLAEMGHGYSCFDLRSGLDNMNEALNDWGKS